MQCCSVEVVAGGHREPQSSDYTCGLMVHLQLKVGLWVRKFSEIC